jgi:hypothetical protein
MILGCKAGKTIHVMSIFGNNICGAAQGKVHLRNFKYIFLLFGIIKSVKRASNLCVIVFLVLKILVSKVGFGFFSFNAIKYSSGHVNLLK